MTKEELKNRISMALKDPILQQGFEIICKENTELDCQKNRNKACYSCANATERCFRNEIGCPCQNYKSYKDENADLKEEINKIAFARGELEKENAELRKVAEFGYNKANEWHYVKNGDLPTKELEGKQLLVRVRNYTENFILAYYMLDLYYSKNGKRFYSDTDCDCPINIKNVIAWKEIVLPKEE